MKKRDLFSELMEALDTLEAERKGQARIKKTRIELQRLPPKVVASATRKKNQVQ
ncbi:hypothetical protein HH213_08955 [Duganella dendranthematis]|jgi:hypothetical protein|uniref:Uncharacterized protein n=1 Tax=Duganella dendranthematis TaxID=2728021 RepID=A0ABX6M864_9BURK|nr:hypothetical protein [Duganella dendranthematis]QJD90211.1 hypothetical protein HH213_08955 [Duganella dendranthematis]